MRRLITFLTVAAVTAFFLTHWLNDGDVIGAVTPVVAEWDAELLARDAGVGGAPEADSIQAPVDEGEPGAAAAADAGGMP